MNILKRISWAIERRAGRGGPGFRDSDLRTRS